MNKREAKKRWKIFSTKIAGNYFPVEKVFHRADEFSLNATDPGFGQENLLIFSCNFLESYSKVDAPFILRINKSAKLSCKGILKAAQCLKIIKIVSFECF